MHTDALVHGWLEANVTYRAREAVKRVFTDAAISLHTSQAVMIKAASGMNEKNDGYVITCNPGLLSPSVSLLLLQNSPWMTQTAWCCSTLGGGLKKHEFLMKIRCGNHSSLIAQNVGGFILFAYYTLLPFLKKSEKSMPKGTSKVVFWGPKNELGSARVD